MARIVCIKGLAKGETFQIEAQQVRLGKSSSNDIVLPHNSVSPKHAIIRKEGMSFSIEDLDSLGGTFVNQEKVDSSLIKDEDEITLGEVSFSFQTKGTTDDTRSLTAQQPTVKLICEDGMEKGFEFTIKDNVSSIGRSESNAIKLFHKSISRKHSEITIEGGKVYLSDLGSMNGTRLNGKDVKSKTEIKNNDHVEIGELKFLTSIEEPAASEDATIISPYKTVVMSKDDLEGLESSELENVLMLSSVQASEPGSSIQDVQEPELAEKPFLDKIVAIEWERQRLCQLHAASKALYAMESKSELQKYLGTAVEQFFKFKNLLLLDDTKADKPFSKKGTLSYSKVKEALLKVAPAGGHAVLLDLRKEKYKNIRSAGAGAMALLGRIECPPAAGLFYLDFNDVMRAQERLIFDMFVDVLSIVIARLR